jgi:hypothetical protein
VHWIVCVLIVTEISIHFTWTAPFWIYFAHSSNTTQTDIYFGQSKLQELSCRPACCFFVVKGPAADATDAPQPWGLLCNPVMKMINCFVFPSNGAPVKWKWQWKTEVLGEKPVSVPLCPPQIPHGPTRDRTQVCLVIWLTSLLSVSFKLQRSSMKINNIHGWCWCARRVSSSSYI